MHSRLLVGFTITLFSVALAAQRPDGQGQGRRGNREITLRDLGLAHFSAERTAIETKSLRAGRLDCVVYVPKAPADKPADKPADGAESDQTAKPWPVVLWLHGLNDGFHRFHNEGGAAAIDALRAKGEIDEMLVIVPTVARQTLYVDGESNGDVEQALVRDLLAHVEKTWPNVMKDAAHRAVMGVSMGGYGALKIALRHPDVFGVVAAHSSAILPADPAELPDQYERMRDRMGEQLGVNAVFGDPIDPAKWAAHMPLAIVRDADAKKFAASKIYFDAGTEDRYGFAAPNQALDAALTEKEIAHTFRLVEGGGHSWGSDSMLDNLGHSFRFVQQAFAPPKK
ncbi:MAG: prolyl oligopeptidase family serine peptidase [Planctomycetes bacterium]|nr:prolyl oligopeptidase family serine peptidase [Planctomycetota bacterium]